MTSEMTNDPIAMIKNSPLKSPLKIRSHFVWLALVCCLLTAMGCGDGRPGRVPISGQILIDGKPLEKALVRFVPSEGRSSLGQTDSDGRFTLTCYEKNDGATLGKYRVSIIALTSLSGDRVLARVPKKYTTADTSELEVEIQEARDDVEIKITWDGGKPFIIKDE